MREQKKQTNYDAIIKDAEIKQKQQLYIIRRECCPNCVKHSEENCLNIEHTLENSAEVYRCVNYVRKID